MIKKYGIYLLIILLVIVASIMIYIKINPKELPSNLMSATGKIDGDLIALNTKYGGRIRDISIADGEQISQGDIVAILGSREYAKKIEALSAEVDAANDNLKAMLNEFHILEVSVPLEINKAHKAVEIAQAQKKELLSSLRSLQAVVQQSKKDLQRTQTLYEKKLIAQHKLELAQLQYTSDTEKLQALQEQSIAFNKAVEIAQDNYELALVQKKKVIAAHNNIEATKSKIVALKANKEALEAVMDDLSIRSPIDGYVVEKIANKGEVLGAGMVIATLIDPQSLYLKVFVDTMENGKIKIGDSAVIFLDAQPDKAIKAKVVSIAANAEFTPKDVAVRSDRIQRVYAVHLKPLEVDPLLKLGIAAIGVISTDGKNLPESLHEIPSI